MRPLIERPRLMMMCCILCFIMLSYHITQAGAVAGIDGGEGATTARHLLETRSTEGVVRINPPLGFVEVALLTTAREEFEGNQEAYDAAANWTLQRLSSGGEHVSWKRRHDRSVPHLACAEYGSNAKRSAVRQALELVENFLFPGSVRTISHSREQGLSCFVATATLEQASALESAGLAAFGLHSFGPFPTVLKIAPGLLQIQGKSEVESTTTVTTDNKLRSGGGAPAGSTAKRLSATHGEIARMDNVGGLTIELSPGVLPTTDFQAADSFIAEVVNGLVSSTMDLHVNSYWSNKGMFSNPDPSALGSSPAGALRAHEWTRAADVVHGLSSAKAEEEGRGGVSPGDICSWDSISLHHPDRDSLVVTGLDHLLPGGRGAGGREGEEADELKIACFMGLLSYLASTPEVLRVSSLHRWDFMNAVAKAIAQSATTTDIPLTESGLDGTGEVIQVVDSGVDTDSCYFIDEDGETVEFGHYFEEFTFLGASTTANKFAGGYFPVDFGRRKIIQYISFIKANDGDDAYGNYYTTRSGQKFQWYSADGFTTETPGGHGSHTAGTAAGATLNTPPETLTCDEDAGEQLGCVGDCITAAEAASFVDNFLLDLDVMCEAFNCDGQGSGHELCLEGNTQEILASNGGVAQGAKLAIFDASADNVQIFASLAGTGLWDAAEDTGAMVHSNSWGSDTLCLVESSSVEYDEFMHQNPEHLLIFAAGNMGDESRSACTINAPGLGKNVLTVGASSSGAERWTSTAEDGGPRTSPLDGLADIDTVAYFSSQGPTRDNRIKPEILAPGDWVLSASSAGETGESCVLEQQAGTSMSTPVVAGAAAMIRQYFSDSSFYETDVNERGICPHDQVICEAFRPSAATVKAMLINSANLMGESAQPDGARGFGRVHLEKGLPIDGVGDVGLFVADSGSTAISPNSEDTYQFNLVDGDAGEIRATLTWIDPASHVLSTVQLIHDLDLTVTSPSGTDYTMWGSGVADTANVIERVIVPSEDVESAGAGIWTVTVSCELDLTTETQAYSLVVTGPFGTGTALPPSPSTTSVGSRGRGGRGSAAWHNYISAFVVGVVWVMCSAITGGAW